MATANTLYRLVGPRRRLRDALVAASLSVVGADGAGRLRITGGTTQEVGHLAFEAGVELHELVAAASDLERTFLELTEGEGHDRAAAS